MEIRLRATGEVISDTEFYIRNTKAPVPLTQEWLDTFGGDILLEGPQAIGGTVYQYSMRQGVEEIDSQWYTKYVLGPIFTDSTNEDGTVITAAEQEAAYKARRDAEQAEYVRNERNNIIAKTDWTQLADSPVDKTVWAEYRQALRDVPTQAGFPWTIEWPVEPK
jgi:hypothetical protein